MSGATVAELAAATSPLLRVMRGMVRRFTVSTSRLPIWRLLGVRGADGDDEVVSAEVFSGVGFAARPAAAGTPEVIAVTVGGSKAVVVVASRDEKTLAGIRATMGELAAGDTLVYSSAAIVHVRANGTVEVRTPAGTAGALARQQNLEALRAAIQNAVISPGDGGAALKTAILAATWTDGTTVLKGE